MLKNILPLNSILSKFSELDHSGFKSVPLSVKSVTWGIKSVIVGLKVSLWVSIVLIGGIKSDTWLVKSVARIVRGFLWVSRLKVWVSKVNSEVTRV